jgi:hypothetical protein
MYLEYLKGWYMDCKLAFDESGKRHRKYIWANYKFPYTPEILRGM